jgi:DNA-binding MarR family transcriptional regulator
MTSRAKKTAILLGTAVALSSGAYALGSQAGDGGAIASSSGDAGAAAGGTGAATAIAASRTRDRDHDGPGDRGLSTLADRLGVTPAALRTALQELRATQPSRAARRAKVASALAAALNIPVAKVTAALDDAAPDRGAKRDTLSTALAAELKLDAATVRAALDKVLAGRGRDGGHDRRGGRGDRLAAALATELKVDAAAVRAALDKVRPGRRDRHDGRGRLGGLATALGVEPAALRTALQKIATGERNAFAAALAQKLSMDASKVQDALTDLPRGPRGGRRHG